MFLSNRPTKPCEILLILKSLRHKDLFLYLYIQRANVTLGIKALISLHNSKA